MRRCAPDGAIPTFGRRARSLGGASWGRVPTRVRERLAERGNEGAAMYAMVRRDRVADPVRRDEVAQRIADGLVPVLRRIAGCVACYVVAAEDGDVLSVAVFAGRAGADASRREAAAWIERYVAPLLAEPADVVSGTVWGGRRARGRHLPLRRSVRRGRRRDDPDRIAG